MFLKSILGLGIAGLCTCTGYLFIVAAAMMRFQRRKRQQVVPGASLPSVTLLKPLCGLEPNLRENLASFFNQNYLNFEIVFGLRDASDPALRVLRSVQEEYPWVPVAVVFAGPSKWPNAKVWSLEKMYAKAAHDYLIISDSDVCVSRDYIESITQALIDPATGLITCLYRGAPTGGLWSRLEALGMSVEMTAGVLASDILEGMTFALGPTMALRREVLDSIGGFAALGQYCADDYVLGNLVHKAGWKVEISTLPIDHVVLNRSFVSSLLHQLRWMKSARFSRPAGHLSSVLSFGMPFAIIATFAEAATRHLIFALCFLGWGLINRLVMAIIAGWKAVGDRNSLRYCWLFPLRDLMGFGFWVASFVGNTVVWREQTYQLEAGGRMAPVYPEGVLIEEPASAPVAVDNLA
jgi:ceramide glucosyltransferase